MKTRSLVLLTLVPVLITAPGRSVAGDVDFSGSVSGLAVDGVVFLGTFRPGFDPFSYASIYSSDAWGNMYGPSFSQAVADDNFRPIASTDLSFSVNLFLSDFSGTGTVNGIEGEPLWLFGFNRPDPDSASNIVLCSGGDASWLAPSDTGSAVIDANTATQFVFGGGGYGNPLELSVLPFPEPSSAALLSSGLLALLCAVSQRARILPPQTRPSRTT